MRNDHCSSGTSTTLRKLKRQHKYEYSQQHLNDKKLKVEGSHQETRPRWDYHGLAIGIDKEDEDPAGQGTRSICLQMDNSFNCKLRKILRGTVLEPDKLLKIA